MKRRTPKKLPAVLPAGLESEVMTVREVAQYFGCHQTTIYKLIKSFQLPGFHLGGDWRFLRSDVVASGSRPGAEAIWKRASKDRWAGRGRKPKPKTTKS